MFKINGYQPKAVALRQKAAPIRQLWETPEGQSLILNAIDELTVYMGVRSELPKKQVLAMGAWTVKHFGTLNPLELVEAFSMAAAGELYRTNENGQQVPLSAETYQSFSAVYMGKILRAYLEHRTRVQTEWERDTQAMRLNTPVLKPSSEEFLQMLENKAQEGELMLAADWDSVFTLLVDMGEISISEKDKRDYLGQVHKALSKERNPMNPKPQALKPSELKRECRKRLIYTWLKAKYPEAKYPINTQLFLPNINLKQNQK